MPNYTNGKIYKILNAIDDELYVGSTVEPLCKRMAKHRHNVNQSPHFKLYKHMINHGIDNFYIELIENYACSSKEELQAKEGSWIRQVGTLNSRIEGRTQKERRQEHPEYMIQYRSENVERIRQQVSTYNQNHKEMKLEVPKARFLIICLVKITRS